MPHQFSDLRGALLGVVLLLMGAGVAAAAPIAQWQFNGDLNDSIGNFNLTFHGTDSSPDYVTDANGHQSLALDGVDQYADVAVQGTPLDFNHSSFTIAAWLTIEVPSDERRVTLIAGRRSSSGLDDYAIALDYENFTTAAGHNPIAEAYTNPGGGAGSVTSTVNFNQYLNLIMTYDQSTTTVTLYRNGVRRSFKITNGTGPYSNSTPLEIGHYISTFTNAYLKADLDEVRIYNTALDQDEVTALYNSGKGPAPLPEPGSLPLLALGGLLCTRNRRKK
jgi:hypothetical protein